MMTPYVSLMLIWTWGAPLNEAPEARLYIGAETEAVEVSPLVLHWTPTEGFTAQSQVSVSAQQSKPFSEQIDP